MFGACGARKESGGGGGSYGVNIERGLLGAVKTVVVFVVLLSTVDVAKCQNSSCTKNCTGGVDYSAWDSLLKSVVVEGQVRKGIRFNAVDFQMIRTNRTLRRAHKKYLRWIARTDVETMSLDEALAFMLNAYNAIAMDLIVTKNPKGDIRLLSDLFQGSVFDRFKYTLLVGGQKLSVSLNDVEHQIIRKSLTRHDMPEIHSAVNCMSLSCPDIRAEAYTGGTIRQQLREQTISWLQNEGKGLRADAALNVVWMSELFNWFREDFTSSKHGGRNDLIDAKEPIDWAVQFATPEVKAFVRSSRNFTIRPLTYEWDLIKPNGQ